jgi:hypothetical protein
LVALVLIIVSPASSDRALQVVLVCGSASVVPPTLQHISTVINVCIGNLSLPGHHMVGVVFHLCWFVLMIGQMRVPLPDASVRALHVSGVLQRYSHRLVNAVLADWSAQPILSVSVRLACVLM